MENQQSLSQHSDDQSEPLFPTNEPFINSLEASSNPTKQKVKNFKNRVFSLLMLYIDKSKTLEPMFESLTQQVFIKEPERMRHLFSVLTRKKCSLQNLKKIVEFYRIMLLHKVNKKISTFCDDFISIIKKVSSLDEQYATEVVKGMLEHFLTKRKCRIQATFFLIIAKKFPMMRNVLLLKCSQMLKDTSLRAAQQKQLEKIHSKLSRKEKKVKVEEDSQN